MLVMPVGTQMGAQELAIVGLAGSGLGVALGLPMVWPVARRGLDVRLLGGVVLVLAAFAALISARLAGFVPTSRAVEHLINLIGLIGLPLAIVYTRHAGGAATGARLGALLWAPAGAYAALLAIRTGLGLTTQVPFAWLLPAAIGMTVWCAIETWTRRGRRAPVLVAPEWVVAFAALLNVAQIVRMSFAHVAVVRAAVPLMLCAAFVALVVFVAWRTVAPAAADIQAAAPRYERSGLDASVAPDLLARIDDALTRDRLFAQPNLTLAQLAGAVSATPHQVSEALNRYASVTFHELLNRRRVEDVKAQLLNPESDRFTIEGIGASAGFGSRSALYAAFRRYEAMTPSEFRELHRSDSAK